MILKTLAMLLFVASPALANYQHCSVAKEYISTYRYLEDQKEFKLNAEQIEGLSEQVAAGCEGAAKRFASTVDTLVKAQLDSASAIKLGRDLALRNDGAAATFLTVFKASYAADFLDLDLFQSMNQARALTLDIEEVPRWLERDFKTLARLCVQDLEIPRPKCATFVTNLISRVIKMETIGDEPAETGIAAVFTEGLDFLVKSDEGPKLARFNALQLMEQLISMTPKAYYEFRGVYDFVREREKRPLSRKDALNYALKLAKSSKLSKKM